MSVVRLTRVCKAFANGARGLGPIDFEVAEGEVVTLIGPSGCGKTTALRLIAGLAEPSEGEVVWPKGRPEIGYVFQEPTLMPWASAFANVWLPLRLSGVSRAQATPRIEEALERVGLRDAATLKPHQLSGGMRMRVSIARALVTRPKLLLMDEPFAALDEITRFHLNDELLALREKLGLTLVFVTHSVFEAVYLSSRVVVMTPVPGRIVEEVGVPEPFPRTDAFRTSVAYAGFARTISAALRQSSESRLDKSGIAVQS